MRDDCLDACEVLSNHYGHFMQNVESPGMSYCGLSYLTVNVERGSYLLIPLLVSPPEGEVPYILEVNCLPATLLSRLTIIDISKPRYSHSSEFAGCWLQPIEMPLSGHFTVSTKLLDSGYICIFRL